jgi:ABC-type polysaccharide/polyol phosphate export permease
MKFEFTKLVGFLAMIGTVIGLVLAGSLYDYNPLLAVPFMVMALVSFIMFAGFLYHFFRYAEYYIPVENLPDEEEKEEV